MDDYYFLDDAESFVFSAENQTGTKEGGGRGGDCTKLSPKIYMEPGQTVTIAEIDGPGEIDHMWFTGVINHGCIIRIYWENSEIPSVDFIIKRKDEKRKKHSLLAHIQELYGE